MNLWIRLLPFSVHIYALLTQYAAKTRNGNSLPSEPAHQELAMITATPKGHDGAALQQRAAIDNTCAYVSGNAASPLTCPSGSSCTVANGAPYWTCCDATKCQEAYSLCFDYGSNVCSDIDAGICSQILKSYLSCPSASPSCVTYVRSNGSLDFNPQLSLGCGKLSGDVLALYLSTTGEGKGNDGEANPTSGGIPAPVASTVVPLPTDILDTSSSSGSGLDEANPTSRGISAPVESIFVSLPTGALETYASSGPALGTGSSSSDSSEPSNPGAKSSTDNGLSPGVIAGIVIPAVAMVVAVIVAWWKRHQVVWCITFGRHGDKHSKRTPKGKSSVPNGNQLATRPTHSHPGLPPSHGSHQYIFINGPTQQNFNTGRHP